MQTKTNKAKVTISAINFHYCVKPSLWHEQIISSRKSLIIRHCASRLLPYRIETDEDKRTDYFFCHITYPKVLKIYFS